MADGTLSSITGLFYSKALSSWFFTGIRSSNHYLYKTDLSAQPTEIGQLTSTDRPFLCDWSDKLIIASGGKLQSYDNTTFTTIEDSGNEPTAVNFAFTRFGRVVAVQDTGAKSDYLGYSGVGDETNWTTSTASDYLETQVGYKDAGDIVAVVPLRSTLVVFKSSGIVYRVDNEPSDWTITEIGRNVSCEAMGCAVGVENTVFFLGQNGFAALNPAQEWGDLMFLTEQKPFVNVNVNLKGNVDSNARVWHVPARAQVWIKTQADNRICIYDLRKQAFTFRETSADVIDVVCKDGDTYLAMGTGIYKIDPSSDEDDGNEIAMNIKGKRYVSLNNYHLSAVFGEFSTYKEGNITLTAGKNSFNVILPEAGTKIYDLRNTEIFSLSSTAIYSDTRTTLRKKRNSRNETFQFEITCSNGSVGIRRLEFIVAEVD